MLGREKNKQASYYEKIPLQSFEINLWSAVSFHFWIIPIFHYKTVPFPTMLQYPVQNVYLNVDSFSSVAAFETTFSFMGVFCDGFQTARLDLKKLLEIQ